MRIARVIGTVTLNKHEPSLRGARYCVAIPLSLENLLGKVDKLAEPLIVYDDLGATEGSLIAMSESREAAQPFAPEVKPIDAYCAALLDAVNVKPLEKTKTP